MSIMARVVTGDRTAAAVDTMPATRLNTAMSSPRTDATAGPSSVRVRSNSHHVIHPVPAISNVPETETHARNEPLDRIRPSSLTSFSRIEEGHGDSLSEKSNARRHVRVFGLGGRRAPAVDEDV